MLSFEEIVRTAIENQHIILEMDLKKGLSVLIPRDPKDQS